MRVVVTGANGFIGAAVTRALGARARPLTRAQADFSGAFDARAQLAGCEQVVHTAGRAHTPADASFHPVNVSGTRRLAEQAAEVGVRRFVFLSSIGVTVTPDEPYARTKREAEAALAEVAATHGLEVVVIRPTLVYGPGAPGNWAQLMRLVRSGVPLPFASVDNRRSFIALDNLVDLVVRCVELDAPPPEPLAASDAEPISTSALIRRIARALGRSARLWPCPPALLLAAARLAGRGAQMHKLVDSLVVDSRRTTALTGWAPRDRLDETLRRCVS